MHGDISGKIVRDFGAANSITVFCPERVALRVAFIDCQTAMAHTIVAHSIFYVGHDTAADPLALARLIHHEKANVTGGFIWIGQNHINYCSQRCAIKKANIKFVCHRFARRQCGHIVQNALPGNKGWMILVKQRVLGCHCVDFLYIGIDRLQFAN